MIATTPGCPAIRSFKEGVVNAAARVPGVGSVDIVMTFDPPWAPSRIAPIVRALARLRRGQLEARTSNGAYH
jgi:metal-sulfur cluster biosynthetic enzyme